MIDLEGAEAELFDVDEASAALVDAGSGDGRAFHALATRLVVLRQRLAEASGDDEAASLLESIDRRLPFLEARAARARELASVAEPPATEVLSRTLLDVRFAVDRYERRIARRLATECDPGELREIVATLERAASSLERLAKTDLPSAAREAERVRALVMQYEEEAADLEREPVWQRMLVDLMTFTYATFFASRPRLTRRPEILERMLARWNRATPTYVPDETRRTLEAFEREREAIAGARASAPVETLRCALEGEARAVMARAHEAWAHEPAPGSKAVADLGLDVDRLDDLRLELERFGGGGAGSESGRLLDEVRATELTWIERHRGLRDADRLRYELPVPAWAAAPTSFVVGARYTQGEAVALAGAADQVTTLCRRAVVIGKEEACVLLTVGPSMWGAHATSTTTLGWAPRSPDFRRQLEERKTRVGRPDVHVFAREPGEETFWYLGGGYSSSGFGMLDVRVDRPVPEALLPDRARRKPGSWAVRLDCRSRSIDPGDTARLEAHVKEALVRQSTHITLESPSGGRLIVHLNERRAWVVFERGSCRSLVLGAEALSTSGTEIFLCECGVADTEVAREETISKTEAMEILLEYFRTSKLPDGG